jgi:hypothetical protein
VKSGDTACIGVPPWEAGNACNATWTAKGTGSFRADADGAHQRIELSVAAELIN